MGYPEPSHHAHVAASLFDDFGRGGYRFASQAEINRRGEVFRQIASGATGGGMACPECGKRALMRWPLETATRMCCGPEGCGCKVRIVVRDGGVFADPIA